MKKFGFNCQMRNEPFLIVIYHSSLVKGAMNAARVCKLRNGVKKTPQFLLFSQAKGGKKTIAHLSIAEGSSFWSLDRLINDYKLQNEKKIFDPKKCAMNIFGSYLNWWHNWQLKNRRRSHSFVQGDPWFQDILSLIFTFMKVHFPPSRQA